MAKLHFSVVLFSSHKMTLALSFKGQDCGKNTLVSIKAAAAVFGHVGLPLSPAHCCATAAASPCRAP